MRRLLLVPAAALLALSLAACRSAGGCCPRGGDPIAAATFAVAEPSAPSEAFAPAAGPAAPTASGTILDHRDGSAVTFDAMVDRLATASHVYVGELHDQANHHAFQAKVFEALYGKWRGKRVALGLEMFYRPFQPALDAYVAGEIDEKEMLEKTDWDGRWHNYWDAYAPMIRFCREHRIPVLALNAPREVTTTARVKGLAALSPEQKAMLPDLDFADAAHRAHFKAAFGPHAGAMGEEKLEGFYRAFLIWDEVMGATVASFLARNGPDAHVVVVAGDGHVGDRCGIPAHAEKRTGRSYLTVVQYDVEAPNPHAALSKGQGAPGAGKGHEEADDSEPDPRLSLAHADYSAWWSPSTIPPTPPTPRAKPASAPPSGEAPKP